ncbi:MAG: hypothetical protein IKY66_09225 [Bacteroidales bacterium]|nr:hypothetical protein [Bacteroidales bacterium]
MKYILLRLKRFCGFITGFVFFIGGILKLMDPVGAGLVMGEYLDFMHMKFLGFAAKPLGLAFALAETVIGTALITGVWRKITGIAALAFQSFFTMLTLALVTFNPQMDCGCFGEAVHLTHMETFVKNIVLLVLICAYLFPARMLGVNKRRKYVSFALVMISVLTFTVYSWRHIPLVDYTDYETGALLKSGEAISYGEDLYKAVFVYEKDGEEKIFDLEELPDSTWNFVRTETVQSAAEDSSGLIDLSFYDADGNYMDHLAAEGRVIVVSVYDPTMKEQNWRKVETFIKNAQEAGFNAFLLVSGTPEVQLDIPIYTADFKTLLAMNRSNGGATYFSEGYLVRKWSRRSLPDMDNLNKLFQEDETETVIYHDTKGSLGFQGFLLYVFAVMLLL